MKEEVRRFLVVVVDTKYRCSKKKTFDGCFVVDERELLKQRTERERKRSTTKET